MKTQKLSLRFICSLLTFIIFVSPMARAAELDNTQPESKDNKGLEKLFDPNTLTLPARLPYTTLKEDLKLLPKQVLADSEKSLFERNNLIFLLMAGGGSIALADRADDKIADHFDRHDNLPDALDKAGDWMGNPGFHFAASAIWYLTAAHNKDELSKQRSWAMIRALSVTGLTTIALKGIVNNHTPNDKAFAWPSGHTSSSFCVAAVLDEFYGPKVGIPAYAAAGFVGYRMMDSGDHWASDVLFGAVLGYVVGHTVAGEHKKLEVGGFTVVPMTRFNPEQGSSVGVAFAKEF